MDTSQLDQILANLCVNGRDAIGGIVKQNHGFIHVDSRPGSGTTFYIYLPRHTKYGCVCGAGGSVEPIEDGLETILLVEDEPTVLKMTATMLQDLGYAVLPANSPETAICLAKVHAGAFHLLMTDVVMPEMNGRDLAERLASFMPQLKVLLMSGYTADIIAWQGKLDAGLHFIQKPFTSNELADKVRAALAGQEGSVGIEG